ncbi:MAG: methyltransferase domain-containing protein [Acidobacteriota bacterium]
MKYCLMLLCFSLSAQVAEKANEGYKTPEARARVGSTLAAPDRDARQKPNELVAAMGLKPGMSVADVGTGVGYMLPFLSKAVGAGGKVYAQDIFPDFLDKARQHAAAEKLTNVEFVLGKADDPKLPEGSLDAILMLDVYHHIDYPAKLLTQLRKALKPDGHLVIVEYHKNETAMANGRALQHIRLAEGDAEQEIESNGFRLLSHHDHVPKVQWMGIFAKK